MAENLINEIIDKVAIDKQLKHLDDSLLNLSNKIKEFPKVKSLIEDSSSFKEFITSQKNLVKLQDELIVSSKKVQAEKLKLAQIYASEAKATKELASAKLQEEKATVQSAKAKEIEGRLIEKVAKEKDKIQKATIREQKALEDLNNDYKQLSIAYNDAALKSKNYALRLGENHPVTLQAVADAKAMHDVLLRLDQRVGQSQRNVGNYTSATFALNQVIREAPAFANSFATGISGISNNIPILIDQFKILRAQVGSGFQAFKILAGSLLSFSALLPIGFLLLQTYGSEISAFFSKIVSGSKKVNELRENQNALNEVYKDANKNAGEQIASLKVLYEASTDVSLSMKDRLKAVQGLKSEFPDYFKGIDNEIILNGKAQKSYDSLYTSIIKTSRAKAAKDKLDAIESQRLDIAFTKQKIGTATNNELNRVKGDIDLSKDFALDDKFDKITTQGKKLNKFTEQQQKDEITRRRDRALKDAEDKDQTLKRQSDFLVKYVGLDNLVKDVIGKPKKEKKEKEVRDIKDGTSEDILATQFEIDKLRIQSSIDANKRIINDETKSYDERLTALRSFGQSSIELVTLEKDFNKDAEALKLSGIITELEKQKSEKGANIKAINEQEENERKASTARLKLIEAKYLDELSKLRYGYLDQQKTLADQQIKIKRDQLDEFKKLEEEELAFDKKIKDALKKSDEDEAARKKKFAIDAAAELKAIKNKTLQDAINTSQAFANASFEKEKNRLQEQINLLDEKTKREIDSVSSSTLAEKDKADRISVIQARSNADKIRLEKLQKQEDIKKAKTDKQFALLNLAIKTFEAIGIIKAKAAAAFPLGALFLAQIPFVIASAALQAAAILATPIPKYKHGKRDSYEGLAVVGDGGKREPIIRESGRIELSPATSTMTYLKAKDIVLPDVHSLYKFLNPDEIMQRLIGATNLNAIIKNAEAKQQPTFETFDFDAQRRTEYSKQQLRTLERIERAIDNDKQVIVPYELTPHYQQHIKH